uniref:UPF0160 protein MYG1, mitochondrial n=1 Tax=Parastrongyloides trichosuri TaxID=131310 RepID=A0A0N4ZS60_PARTI
MATIGTHNGKFHTDDALACFFLKTIPEFKNAKIIRTRNNAVLEKTDIVVDVGGVYDHENKKYDHHQNSFNETMSSLHILPSFDTKLSSAGLIYAHYGKKVIASILNLPLDDPNIDFLYIKMYSSFVEAIDAVDNGISCYDSMPKYIVAESIDSRVNDLMPYWNSEDSKSEDVLYKQFLKAIEIVGNSFKTKLRYFYFAWIPARNILKEAIDKRFDFHSCGKFIFLKNGGLPWKSHFLEMEEELSLNEEDILFVIYKDEINNRYKIQCIPARNSTNIFENRIGLKENWRGLEREKLAELSNIHDINFVHSSGFIGGADTLESVIKMGLESIE